MGLRLAGSLIWGLERAYRSETYERIKQMLSRTAPPHQRRTRHRIDSHGLHLMGGEQPWEDAPTLKRRTQFPR